jgi:tetratricopeptide (TPR) repeat protein
MKKIYLFLLIVITGTVLYTQEDKIRIAVSPFDDKVTALSESEKAGASASGMLEKTYLGIDRFQTREMNAISDYITLMEKAQVGLLAENAMKGDSEKLKVDYLTVGTVSKFGDIYEVDARTVKIDDWTIVHSFGTTSGSVDSAVKDISWNISEKFNKKYITEREKISDEKPTVSVSKFVNDNIAAQQAGFSSAFAEILNSLLGSFSLISTVEMKYSSALLDEKSLEMIGVVENEKGDSEFSVRGIAYNLTGNFKVFKDIICINYRLYNTADNRLVFMGIKEIASARGLRPAAYDIANTIEDVLNNRIGTLQIESDPGDAEIFIDDNYAGKTPLIVSANKGTRKISAKLRGYENYLADFEIKPMEINKYKIKMEMLSMELIKQAFLLESMQNWKGAVEAYQRFIDKYSNNEEANNIFYRKGHLELVQLKNYSGALNTFTTLVNRYPDAMVRAEGYFGIARTQLAMGNKEKSKEALDYLLEKYGDTPAAEEALVLKSQLK